MNDVLSCIEPYDLAFVLLEINSVDIRIQFTIKEETNISINFLDLNILRDNNGYLKFEMFRKPIHAEKYLNFSSYHPQQHNSSVISSLLTRS